MINPIENESVSPPTQANAPPTLKSADNPVLPWRPHLHTALRLFKSLSGMNFWGPFRASPWKLCAMPVIQNLFQKDFWTSEGLYACRWDLHSNSVGPWVHCLGRDLNSQVLKNRELGISRQMPIHGHYSLSYTTYFSWAARLVCHSAKNYAPVWVCGVPNDLWPSFGI